MPETNVTDRELTPSRKGRRPPRINGESHPFFLPLTGQKNEAIAPRRSRDDSARARSGVDMTRFVCSLLFHELRGNRPWFSVHTGPVFECQLGSWRSKFLRLALPVLRSFARGADLVYSSRGCVSTRAQAMSTNAFELVERALLELTQKFSLL